MAPMNVYIVQGEHQYVPGRLLYVLASDTAAHTKAAELLNLMLADAGMPADATRVTWEERLEALRAAVEDGDPDVWITEAPVED